MNLASAPARSDVVAAPRFRALPPLSLYIHVPWCLRKCPYCDFNSHAQRGEIPEEAYVEALLVDLETALPAVWGRRLQTVFFGGGTPSLLSARAIDNVLAGVRARIAVDPGAEITLEANPGTFEREKFAAYRSAGVTRLSLGVQSFDPRRLESIGRVHDEREARAAVEAALALFEEVNVDLMFALPGQTLEAAQSDVDALLAYSPPHVSLYHLTIEPNTLFHRRPPSLPDEDVAAGIEDMIGKRLAAAGYDHYETSAYARPGHRCRHNLNYWRFGDYLGIGAGAHSKLSSPERIVREVRYKQPGQYMRQAARGAAVVESHEVSGEDAGFEFMLNALRLAEGVAESTFEERTGRPLSTIADAIDKARARGLLSSEPGRLAPTELGRRFLNELQAMFLPRASRTRPPSTKFADSGAKG